MIEIITYKKMISIFIKMIIFSFLTFQIACNFFKPEDYIFSKIFITSKVPIIWPNGKIENNNDSACIIYYKNYTIYQLSKYHILEDEKKVLRRDTLFNYFIFSKESKYGLWLDSLKSKKYIYLPVDSMSKEKIYGNIDFTILLDYYSLIKSQRDKPTNDFIETYKPKSIDHEKYCDTLTLFYNDRLKNIQHSFAKKIDKTKSMKLYKISYLFKQNYSEQFKFLVPQRKCIFEMGELKVNNSKELIYFFETNKKALEQIK
jgi:hypothetical protein